MTQKRFSMVYGEMGEFRVKDNETGDYISIINGSNDEDIVLLDKLNALNDENEQLKHDATVLIQANQDYRRENKQLRQQVDYIQNSITEHIKHQKTELGQKALKEIIQDYNDWLIGHK